jgi:hypothetical protein
LPLGLSGRTQLVEDSPQVVHASAVQARDDRAVQPVQETRPAAASDEKGDEVASRSVVQDLHHALLIRKPHTRAHALTLLDLYGSCPISRRVGMSE